MGILGLGLQGQVRGLDLGLVPKSLLQPLRAVCRVKTMHAMPTGNRENVSKSGWLISGGPTRSVARGRASFTAWRVSSKHVITYRRVAFPSRPAGVLLSSPRSAAISSARPAPAARRIRVISTSPGGYVPVSANSHISKTTCPIFTYTHTMD